jgi:hypothetical protein
VHAKRLVHKLIPFNDRQRLAIDLVRQLIWWFYADLKAYRDDPCRKRRTQLRARFERIFKRRTWLVTLDRLLARLHARKNELLLLLDRPEIPLHSNGSENDNPLPPSPSARSPAAPGARPAAPPATPVSA